MPTLTSALLSLLASTGVAAPAVEGAAAPPEPTAAAAAADPLIVPGAVRLYLRDGRRVVGRVVERDTRTLVVESLDGERVALEYGEIRAVVPIGPAAAPVPVRSGDPARVRLLAAPTAFQLLAGEVTAGLERTEGRLSISPVPLATVSVSAVVPAFATAETGWDVSARATVGQRLWRDLHAAVGAQASYAAGATVAVLLGAVSYGTPERHVTLSAGPPFAGSARAGLVADVGWALGGVWALHPAVAIVTEHWVTRGLGRTQLHDGLALRVRLGPVSIDGGAFVSPSARTATPWVALTYVDVPFRSW